MNLGSEDGKLWIYRDSVDGETGDVVTVRTPHYVRLADIEAHIGYTVANIVQISGINEWPRVEENPREVEIAKAWVKEAVRILGWRFSDLQTVPLERMKDEYKKEFLARREAAQAEAEKV